jgi:hypothetical protein
VVRFPLGQYGDIDIDGDFLHHTQNSPYVAVCLAAYMGAARIGLIPPLPRKTLPELTIIRRTRYRQKQTRSADSASYPGLERRN